MKKSDCKDCGCLVEGDNQKWVCDSKGVPIEDVAECPETDNSKKEKVVTQNVWYANNALVMCKYCRSRNVRVRKNGPHYELFCADCLEFVSFLKANKAKRLLSIQEANDGKAKTESTT